MSVESRLQDLKPKLAALGVYGLKGLQSGLSVLNEAGELSKAMMANVIMRECTAAHPTASVVSQTRKDGTW